MMDGARVGSGCSEAESFGQAQSLLLFRLQPRSWRCFLSVCVKLDLTSSDLRSEESGLQVPVCLWLH